MSVKLVSVREVNLYECPKPTEAFLAKDGSEWTLGDLHGNFIKLVHFLGLHGFIKIDDARYQNLLAIYLKNTHEITKEDLEQFNTLIDSLDVIQPNALVRLIGDVLADRGQNDYFTLKLIAKLVKSNLKLEILLSNHDLEFIKRIESDLPFLVDPSVNEYFASMVNLQQFIDRGLVALDEIKIIFEAYYKPALKLVSYSINTTKDEIVLYSHGKMGFETIEHLATYLNVDYDDSTAEALGQTMDRINQAYAQVIAENQVDQSYDKNAYAKANTNEVFNCKDHPIVVVTQNRSSYGITRPPEKNGYRIFYVHGHDSNEPSWKHIFNLDNFLGKMSYILRGFYHVFCFQPWPEPVLESVPESTPDPSVTTVPTPKPISKPYSLNQLLRKFSQMLEFDDSPLDCPFDALPAGFQQYWDTQTNNIRLAKGNFTAENYWLGADIDEKGKLFHEYTLSL